MNLKELLSGTVYHFQSHSGMNTDKGKGKKVEKFFSILGK